MRRKEHILKKNTRTSAHERWLFFDVENDSIQWSKNFTYMPVLFGYYCYWRRRTNRQNDTIVIDSFSDTEDFIRVIEKYSKSGKTLYCVAHNIHHDIGSLNLLNALANSGWELGSFYSKARTTIIRMRKGKKRICFLDSLNWFPGKLENWAPLVGLKKVHVDFSNFDIGQLHQRCYIDVLILQRLVAQWIKTIKEEDLGEFKDTLPSQAFAAFRHKFMNTKIVIHDNEEALRIERLAYGGGMVKCGYVGHFKRQKFYRLDVNSMYPAVMHSNYFPVSLREIRYDISVERLVKLLEKYCVIAVCTVHPREGFYRRNTGQYVIYPHYKFKGVFSTPELIALYQEHAIKEVHTACIYHRDKPFQSYVDYFYKKRMEYKAKGESLREKMMKLMLNSLYGKFGARSSEWIRCPDAELHSIKLYGIKFLTDEYIQKVYYIGDKAYLEKRNGEAYNSFPAIAAHVTAYARMLLNNLMDIAGLENVYYTDTDSLIVNEKGFKNLEILRDDTELGKLKLEKEVDSLTIFSRKDYIIGDEVKMKGIPIDSKVIEQNTFLRKIWPSLRTIHSTPGGEAYGITEELVTLQRQIHDGVILENGHVLPFQSPPDFDPDPLSLPSL